MELPKELLKLMPSIEMEKYRLLDCGFEPIIIIMHPEIAKGCLMWSGMKIIENDCIDTFSISVKAK